MEEMEVAFQAAFYTAKILRLSIAVGAEKAARRIARVREGGRKIVELTRLEEAGKVL